MLNGKARLATSICLTALEGISIDLGGIVGSLGYEIEVQDNFKLIPNMRIGTGISDDTVLGIDVEMDHIYGAGIKAQLESDKPAGMCLAICHTQN